jgi:hypothetical protein
MTGRSENYALNFNRRRIKNNAIFNQMRLAEIDERPEGIVI